MKTFKKNYIGKGTQVPFLQIVKVTLKVAELMNFVYEYEGEDYVTIEIAKMQKPDMYGKDHTVYCTTLEEVVDENPAPKKRKSQKPEMADLPF